MAEDMFFPFPPAGYIHGAQLEYEIDQGGFVPAPGEEWIQVATDNTQVIINGADPSDEAALGALVAAHVPDPEYFPIGKAQGNSTATKSWMRPYMEDLLGQSPQDITYAMYARALAYENGETQETIMGIDTRQQAEAYIAGLPEWQAMPVEVRTFMALLLRANARMFEVIHIASPSFYEQWGLR